MFKSRERSCLTNEKILLNLFTYIYTAVLFVCLYLRSGYIKYCILPFDLYDASNACVFTQIKSKYIHYYLMKYI